MVGKWVHGECLGISEVSDNLNGFCIAGVLDLVALYYGRSCASTLCHFSISVFLFEGYF